MERSILRKLEDWKNKNNFKPLILQGARQVGKTWVMKEFGRRCFDNFLYVSFNDSIEAKILFEQTYNTENLLLGLETLCKEKITKGKTLIILDEIQECERALSSLKFFNENIKGLHVMAAGSLLGVAVRKRNMSFPVGQVEFLNLKPMSFIEFLWANGENQLADVLKNRNYGLVNAFAEKLTSLFKQYLFVGGMPEAVAEFVSKHDFDNIQKIQTQILTGYRNDFSKYIESFNITKVGQIFDSIPYQLSKENKKFSYKLVKSTARAREYESALEWLCLCGLVKKVCRVSVPKLPLKAYEDNSVFKLFFIDCGLLCRMSGLDSLSLMQGNRIFEEFKGALAEQFIFQTLSLHDEISLFYWTNDNSTMEIDFLMQKKNLIIPIEVKSSTNVKSRSFFNFCEKYSCDVKVRTSLMPSEIRDGLYNIPLYMMEYIDEILNADLF